MCKSVVNFVINPNERLSVEIIIINKGSNILSNKESDISINTIHYPITSISFRNVCVKFLTVTSSSIYIFYSASFLIVRSVIGV